MDASHATMGVSRIDVRATEEERGIGVASNAIGVWDWRPVVILVSRLEHQLCVIELE
jgi:hypothetical protein